MLCITKISGAYRICTLQFEIVVPDQYPVVENTRADRSAIVMENPFIKEIALYHKAQASMTVEQKMTKITTV